MKKVKGAVWVVLLKILAVIVACGVSYGVGYWRGKGAGGGNGDGNAETVSVMATVTETTTETTTVTTEEIEYIEVTVDGNNYLFYSKSYGIDETDKLIADIKNYNEQLTVKIKDENASLKAYETLISAFKEDHIKYIEES